MSEKAEHCHAVSNWQGLFCLLLAKEKRKKKGERKERTEVAHQPPSPAGSQWYATTADHTLLATAQVT